MGFELKIKLRILIKLFFAFMMLLILVSKQAKAQDEFDQLLESGVEDAGLYLDNYLAPIFKGIGFGVANGWNNTARPHKLGGFDITVTVNAAFIPDKDLIFKFNASEYQNLALQSGDLSADLPTVFGVSTDEELEITILDENELPTGNTVTYSALDGLDMKSEVGHNFTPVPMYNLGVGLPKNTDLKIRFTPEINSGDFKGRITGFGILHDVKQWIPGMEESKFDLSGFIGYTKISASYDLTNSEFNNGTDDQISEYYVKAITIQGLISKALVDKKLFEFTVYGGVGVNTISSGFSILGTYDLDESINTLVDPVDLDFKSGGLRLTGGFRTKLLSVLSLHADYTIQEYKTLTVGVGISVK